MSPRKTSTLIASTVAVGAVLLFLVGAKKNNSDEAPTPHRKAPLSASPVSLSVPIVMDDIDLYKLFAADQADQYAFTSGKLSKEELAKHNQDRSQKTLKIAQKDRFKSGNDFFRAATILQRGEDSNQLLFAHDLAINALSLGQSQAGIVAANSEDKYLISIGKSPRYALGGTNSATGSEASLYGVTHTMKQTLGVDPVGKPMFVQRMKTFLVNPHQSTFD